MTDEEIHRVKVAAHRWASQHPHPDRPLLCSADGRSYTPQEIASHIEKETSFGQTQLRLIAHACEIMPLEEFLEGLARARPLYPGRGR